MSSSSSTKGKTLFPLFSSHSNTSRGQGGNGSVGETETPGSSLSPSEETSFEDLDHDAGTTDANDNCHTPAIIVCGKKVEHAGQQSNVLSLKEDKGVEMDVIILDWLSNIPDS
ncbi:Fc.00g082280.m01.CDS01 [Cosmosporella sp. VM-42]